MNFQIVGGDRAADFSIDSSGAITYTGGSGIPLDFDTEPVFSLNIRAFDTEGQFDDAFDYFYLRDVQEGPVITAPTADLYEHPDDGQFVMRVTAVDPESNSVSGIALAADSVGLGFAINFGSYYDGKTIYYADITIDDPSLFDYETDPSARTLNLTTTDWHGVMGGGSVTVNLLDHTAAPTFSQAPAAVVEKGGNTTTTTLIGTDADIVNGDSLTYQITGVTHTLVGGGAGTQTGIFSVDSATGVLAVNTDNLNVDVDDFFTLTIQVQDRDGQTGTGTLRVDVENLAEPPIIDEIIITIGENPQVGDVVAQMTATDPDGSIEFEWQIFTFNADPVWGGGMRWDLGIEIDEFTGLITVVDPTKLDADLVDPYSGDPYDYHIDVFVSDPRDIETCTDFICIPVTTTYRTRFVLVDFVSTPLFDSANFTSISVSETAVTGTVVPGGTPFNFTDADLVNGDRLSYAFEGGSLIDPLGALQIDPETGELSVADSSVLDFETTSQYADYTRIQVTDTEGETAVSTLSLTLNVADTDEAPELTDGQSFSVFEIAPAGSSVGIVLSDVTEPGDMFSIIDGNSEGIFEIDSVTGELFIANPGPLDFETTASYVLAITLADSTAADTADVTINVLDAVENDVAVTKTTQTRGYVKEGETITYTI